MDPSNRHTGIRGRTYTLIDREGSSEGYFRDVRELTDRLVQKFPDEKFLLERIRKVARRPAVLSHLFGRAQSIVLMKDLADSLSCYTEDAGEYLRSLSLSDRLDRTLRTRERQYHLYMVEIELTNRINRDAFRSKGFRMALLAHCLRDFRDVCLSVPDSLEAVCGHCSGDCFIHRGTEIMNRYGISSYISVSMDHDRLFRELKVRHPDMSALGIACVPELIQGMRLCERVGIPAVGIPLDVNRCGRWCGVSLETSFNLGELERLIG